MTPLRCIGCGRDFPRSHGADLYCSPDCETSRKETSGAYIQKLKEAGFLPVDVANLFVKDGVHVTLDQVLHEGMDQTLAKHAEAVRSYRALRKAPASAV